MNTSGIVSEALAIQKIISEELSVKASMPEKISKVLKSLADSLNVDEVLLYATIDENYLELMGQYQALNYKNNIRFDEGTIGGCAALKSVKLAVNLEKNISLISVPIMRLHIVMKILKLIFRPE